MCGIVGAISEQTGLGPHELKIFEQLLYVGTLRGRDSTGVFLADPNTGLKTFKDVGPAGLVTELKDYDKFMDHSVNHSAAIGHNRAATKGAINKEGAHPFTHGDITLVHNGTLLSHAHLTDKHFAVDSEAITYAMSEADNPEDVISELNGAFALVWWNNKEKRMYFIRNSQRPLHYSVSPAGKSIYLASEADMLQWVLRRNDIKSKIEQLKVGTLYSLNLNDFKDRTEKKVKLYSKPSTYYGSWENHYSDKPDEHELIFPKGSPVRFEISNVVTSHNVDSAVGVSTVLSDERVVLKCTEYTLQRDKALLDDPDAIGKTIVGTVSHYTRSYAGNGKLGITTVFVTQHQMPTPGQPIIDTVNKNFIGSLAFIDKNLGLNKKRIGYFSPDYADETSTYKKFPGQKTPERVWNVYFNYEDPATGTTIRIAAECPSRLTKENMFKPGYMTKVKISKHFTLESDKALCFIAEVVSVVKRPRTTAKFNSNFIPPLKDTGDDVLSYYDGPYGTSITLSSLKAYIKDGCAWCTEQMDVDDVVDWYGESPLCEGCAAYKHI